MASLASLAVVFAILIASDVIAVHANTRHRTHRIRGVGSTAVNLVSYHPPSVFETYGSNDATFLSSETPEGVARSFLQEQLGVPADALTRHAGHSNDGVSYEYFTQTINGLLVANAVANVAIKDGKVVSFGASFVKPNNVAAKEPTLDWERVIARTEETVGGKWNQRPTKLEYIAGDDGSCYLTHVIQIQGNKDSTWKELYVDAHDGKIRNVINFVAEHSYRVVPLSYQEPTQKYEILHEPADYSASQHGNNVIVYKHCRPDPNPPNIDELKCVNTTTQSSPNNSYEYAYNPDKEPTDDQNVNAARVNVFYIVNTMHDITYHYGFTENAYNFQNDNFGRGGKGEDRIQVSVQDDSGVNNANFATPPDGQPGQMRMFLWISTAPLRDGALQNDIVVHEFTHGVSNRMTGGGTSRCLQTAEAGGLGEGWSDVMADITEAKTNPISDFTTGSYVTNMKTGSRSYPYSTDKKTNPLTYSSLAMRNEVHLIGEVWATMLHGLFAALVDNYGLSDNLKTGASEMKGNVIMLHLIMDGFQLQPCNPTFVSARNAIIQADVCRYGGKNKCLIWRAFSKRGLGTGAKEGKYVDSYDMPEGC